jgi:hypothetical protein
LIPAPSKPPEETWMASTPRAVSSRESATESSTLQPSGLPSVAEMRKRSG